MKKTTQTKKPSAKKPTTKLRGPPKKPKLVMDKVTMTDLAATLQAKVKKLESDAVLEGMTISQWRDQAEAANGRAASAEGSLEIILQENQGADDEDLAGQYGGTGYEKHAAVVTTRTIRGQLVAAQAKVKELEAELEAATAPVGANGGNHVEPTDPNHSTDGSVLNAPTVT